jgi:hypothetical protein
MARVLVAVSVVLLLLTGSVRDSYASEEWCEYDPVVLVTTPGGSIIPVYLLIGAAGLENLPLVTAAQHSRIVEPTDMGRATLVQLEVLVPRRLGGGTFATRVTASTGVHATGTILDTETGLSGEPMPLKFKLGVP